MEKIKVVEEFIIQNFELSHTRILEIIPSLDFPNRRPFLSFTTIALCLIQCHLSIFLPILR